VKGTEVRIGVHYGSSTDFPSVIEEITTYDYLGIDHVWVGESYGYDAISTLGLLAAKTKNIQLGTSIIGVQTRSAALIAMTAATIDVYSSGRMNLGLGVSGPQVVEGFHDVSFGRPLRDTRQVIEVCRTLWSGGSIASERYLNHGAPYRELKMIHRAPRQSIPIVVAAVGDQNTALAAELADAWMPVFFWPERYREIWGDSLDVGLGRRAPTLGDLGIVVSIAAGIDVDREAFIDLQRHYVAHYVGGMGTRENNFYNRLFRRYGFEEEAEKIQNLYLGKQRDEARKLVPREFLDSTTVLGDEDFVRSRLRAYRRAGVSHININPVGATPGERLAQLERLLEVVHTL